MFFSRVRPKERDVNNPGCQCLFMRLLRQPDLFVIATIAILPPLFVKRTEGRQL